MENNPLVSILMTSYNREKYIATAIDSVLKSTYTNFELIIVDDCSKDSTACVAQTYLAKDSRVKLVVNESNLGDYPNRNKAASLAKGKYIKYVDSDDIIYPHGLEIMVAAMEEYPEAAFGFSDLKVQDKERPYPIFYQGKEAFRKHFFEGGLFHAGPTSAIIRTDEFNKAGGFSGARFISDYEMWLNLSKVTDLVVLQPGLVWCRSHQGQENDVGKLDYYSLNFNLHKEVISSPDCPLSTNEKKMLLGNYRKLLGRRIYQRIIPWYGIKAALRLLRKCNVGPVVFLEALFPIKKIK